MKIDGHHLVIHRPLQGLRTQAVYKSIDTDGIVGQHQVVFVGLVRIIYLVALHIGLRIGVPLQPHHTGAVHKAGQAGGSARGRNISDDTQAGNRIAVISGSIQGSHHIVILFCRGGGGVQEIQCAFA